MPVVQPVLRLGHEIVVLRRKVLLVHERQNDVEIAAAHGKEIASATFVVLSFGEKTGVHQTDADRGAARRIWSYGRNVKDPAHVIAVPGREPPGHHIDPADCHDVDDAECPPVDVFQMKRLVHLESVQHDQNFLVLASTHGELGREIVARNSRQPFNGAVDILAQLRQGVDIIFGEGLLAHRIFVHNGESARRHHDLAQGDGSWFQREVDLSLGVSCNLHPFDTLQLVPQQGGLERVDPGRHSRDDVATLLVSNGPDRFAYYPHDGKS